MDTARIAALLAPYLEGESLSSGQLQQISTYIDLLLKWNARMNLTAVRDSDQIVTRHFGESLFAARVLFPNVSATATLVDVGSGAGFPGLPIAIARPNVRVTLVEAHGKKATFLREGIRSTGLRNAVAIPTRAESYAGIADVVIFRAVEHFAEILPISARLVNSGGRLAALIGSSQLSETKSLMEDGWEIEGGVNLPGSPQRVLWIAKRLGAKKGDI